MGVENKHSSYSRLEKEWKKCIDFTTSEKAVHYKEDLYLPRLSEQDDDEYAMYLFRAILFMLSKRAVNAMSGMITRKDAFINNADDIEEFINDIDSDKNDIQLYISKLLTNFLVTGRGLTLVDYPNVNENLTVAQAEKLKVKPTFVYYDALQIINWKIGKDKNNKNVLITIVLKESVNKSDKEGSDEFDFEEEVQYRVLDIEDGRYRQRLFDSSGNEKDFSEGVKEIFPKMNGKYFDYIPCVIHGGIEPLQPPLLSVVDLNKHHYMLSADEIYGLRMAALPTPYVFGIDPNDENFPASIGVGRVIGSENSEVKTGFREFTGAGLQAVANKLQKLEDSMIKLSIQIATGISNKSATGEAIDYANSTATLSGIVTILESEINKVFKIAVEWMKLNPEDFYIVLNKDFMPQGINAQDFNALLQAYLKGTISYDTYYKVLAKGEITDPHKTPEEELAEIEQNMDLLGLNTDESDDEFETEGV